MDLVLTRGREGVQNPGNLADVICASPLTYQDVELDGERVEVGGDFEGVFGNLVLGLACAHLAESAVEVKV